MNVFQYIKPHYVFLILSLYFGWQMHLVTPPLQAPDEFNHFYRAYQISEGKLLPYTENKRLGGYIPGSIREYMLPFANAATNLNVHLTEHDMVYAYTIAFSEKDRRFMDFPNTSLYSPISYLPQAIALWTARKANTSVANMYDAGRITIYAVWLISMFVVIWLTPFGKWLLTFLFLLPMNQYVANSFSADTITNCVSLLFVALVLKIAFQNSKIKRHQLIWLAVLLLFIAFAKVVYIGLVFLLLLIPSEKFKSRKQHALSKAILFLIAFGAAYLWSTIVMKYYLPYDNYNPAFRNGSWLSFCANYYKQKEHILADIGYFPGVIYRSIFEHPVYYLNGYIGIFGNSDVLLTRQLTWLTYFFIFIVAITELNKMQLIVWKRLFLWLAALASFVLLLLSQHLTWDCVGEGIVDLIQGRYLIPIMPLLFLSLSNSKVNFKYVPVLAVLIYPAIINAYSTKAIKERYFSDKAYWQHTFHCGAEAKNKWNYFLTSEKGLEVNGALSQTDSLSRSGKHSAMLYHKNRFCFTYKFKNVEFGDIIEISGWQKGDDVQLVLSGRGKNCKEFYYPSTEVHYRDSAGWGYMQMLKTFNLKCDSTEAMVFVWCGDSTKVAFFDDFKFSHRKFKRDYRERLKLK